MAGRGRPRSRRHDRAASAASAVAATSTTASGAGRRRLRRPHAPDLLDALRARPTTGTVGRRRCASSGARSAPATPTIQRCGRGETRRGVGDARAPCVPRTILPTTRGRAAFLDTDDAAADVRLAAVHGLVRQASPTPAERAAVAAHAQDPALRALVRSALARPGWQAPP
jgi:hypothetical protein